MVAKTVVAVPQLSDGSVEHGEVPPSPIERQRSPKEGLLQDTRQRSSTEGLLKDTRGSSVEQPLRGSSVEQPPLGSSVEQPTLGL